MRKLILILLCSFFACSLFGQGQPVNPFEIRSANEQPATSSDQATPATPPDNPFEIRPVTTEEETIEVTADGPLIIRRDSNPAILDARGRTLGIHAMLLVILALSWIFFRSLLAKAYRALFNEGLFNQLFRERRNGKLAFFLLPYLLFWASAGFFVYLSGQAFEHFPSDQPWSFFIRLSIGIAAFYLAKHIIIKIIGWLFAVEEEANRYSFLIMIFGIITGMLLIPANMLISYAPAGWTISVVYACIIGLSLIGLLRNARALLLANRFFSSGPLHFLLYICAIEIAPILILYRVIVG